MRGVCKLIILHCHHRRRDGGTAVNFNVREQRAKKVLSDSPGLVDFAIELVNSVLNLPDEQVKFFEEFKLQRNCVINPFYQKVFGAS